MDPPVRRKEPTVQHAFQFRPGTHDEGIFQGVTVANEYHLPDQLPPGARVIDVGAHIGSFSFAAVSRGAKRVLAFEAEPSNYACARRNLEASGCAGIAEVRPQAVWRSDRPSTRLSYAYSQDHGNTGGGNVMFNDRPGEIETVSLDEIIQEITCDGAYRVAWLKIDCEGSEFPILLTSRRLDQVDTIAGEFHELACPSNRNPIPESSRVDGYHSFSMEVLASVLENAGFDVSWKRHDGTNLGLFFAHNRAAEFRSRSTRPSRWFSAAWKALTRRAGAATARTLSRQTR
jgi:FkbM family methyltransferase